MTFDDDDRPMPALGSAATLQQPGPWARCTAGGKPVNPQTGECSCCSD